MKKFFFVPILMSIIFCCGCDKEPRGIVFDSNKITQNSITKNQKVFKIGEKINFAIIDMNGFKDEKIRMQIIKKYEKSGFWGYDIVYGKDFKVELNDKYFVDYVVLHKSGYYVMQAFYWYNRDKSFVKYDFWVK